MQTYCLGNGMATKCESCQKLKNLDMLNQMPDALRLPLQSQMRSESIDACRLTKSSRYIAEGELV